VRRSGDLERVYIGREAKERLRRYAARVGKRLCRALDDLVLSVLDEEGRPRQILLPEELVKEVEDVARMLGTDVSTAIVLAIRTIRVLYSPRLTLADALRPLPELAGIVGEDLPELKRVERGCQRR